MGSSIVLKYRRDFWYYVHIIIHSGLIFLAVIYTPLYILYKGRPFDVVIEAFVVLLAVMSFFIYELYVFLSFREVIIDGNSVVVNGIEYDLDMVDMRLVHFRRSPCYIRIYNDGVFVCKFINDSFYLSAQTGIESHEIIRIFNNIKNGANVDEIVKQGYLCSKEDLLSMNILTILMIKLIVLAPIILMLMELSTKKK